MKSDALRLAFTSGAVAALLIALSASSCDGTTKKVVPRAPDASLGEAGAGGDSAGSGPRAEGGSAGGPQSGSDASAGAAATSNGNGGVSNGGQPNVPGESGAAGAPAGSAGGPADLPDIDAGIGCVAPSGETRLSASSAGLPAAGLALWLRADRGVYMTADHRVCAWADQSGNDQVLLSSADSARPLWVAASLGNQSAIHFDATGRYLEVSNVLGISGASARTLVAVVQLVNTGSRFQAITQGQSGTPGTYLGFDANTFQTVGNREGVYVMNNAYDAALATSTAPRVHVFTFNTMTPGTPIVDGIDYRVNDAPQTLTRTPGGLGNGNFEDFSQANFTLVGEGPDVGLGPDAFIAEVLIYDRALTTTERTATATALQARYGIVN